MEKKQKKKRIKTVYDFNPTPEELKRIPLASLSSSKEEYLRSASEDTIYQGLAYLHYYRGNYLRMKWYALKMKDLDMIHSFFRTITHP